MDQLKVTKPSDEEDGIPATTLREVAVLTELNHPNIVKLEAVIPKKLQTNFNIFPHVFF